MCECDLDVACEVHGARVRLSVCESVIACEIECETGREIVRMRA